ncbi:hypothetical protein VQ02_19800 [Methylobacterium variabile]|uniref:Uncharacterized protein n=1 Tax=Methylobacterium variabile TaxID=298794 RepID=A0A0J6SKI9_9HYPH|nr:hypothetical protein [Methylobacterium variabile]KMO33893.1 hypothetical protein VQ02_19800 [Methylobacterium variabile]
MAAPQTHAAARRRAVPHQAALPLSSGERKLREDEQLSKLYRAYKRAQIQALLDGPFGTQVRELDRFMRRMELQDGPKLVERFREALGWIGLMDMDSRFSLLRLASRRIVALRERHGLEPFNDGVVGDPPRTFHIIKDLLGCR